MGGEVLLIVELIVLFFITYGMLMHYAHKDTSVALLITVFVSWYFGFIGTVLLPLDIAEASASSTGALTSLTATWETLYWITFFCCWLILPVIQEYEVSGEFDTPSRLKKAIFINIKFYAVVTVVGLGLLIYGLVKGLTPLQMKEQVVNLSNAYGLFLIMALLGHGLVDIPKSLWRSSDPKLMIRQIEFTAPDYDSQLYEAESELKEIIAEVGQVKIILKDEGGELRRKLEIVANKCPVSSGPSPTTSASKAASTEFGRLTYDKKVAHLATLHGRIKAATAKVSRAQSQWDNLIAQVTELEALANGNYLPAASTGSSKIGVVLAAISTFWQGKIGRVIAKVVAVFAGVLSCLILWSEVTICIPANLSPMSAMVSYAAGAPSPSPSVGSQVMLSIPLIYMSYCLYSSLLKVKLPFADHYNLYPGKMTDGYALCFNAMYACRMQFALSYNFLMTLHNLPLFNNTSIVALVGQMENDSLLLNTYLPISLIFIAIMFAFNTFSKLLHKLGIDYAAEPDSKNPDHVDKLKEGKSLIASGRRHASNLESGRRASLGGNSKAKPLVTEAY
jgi:hypothetical protein